MENDGFRLINNKVPRVLVGESIMVKIEMVSKASLRISTPIRKEGERSSQSTMDCASSRVNARKVHGHSTKKANTI